MAIIYINVSVDYFRASDCFPFIIVCMRTVKKISVFGFKTPVIKRNHVKMSLLKIPSVNYR